MSFNLKEFLVVNTLSYLLLLVIVSPYQLYVLGFTTQQFITWLWTGFPVNILLTICLTKLTLKTNSLAQKRGWW